MAKTISTHHNWPDIHDEGRVLRYGLFIAIGFAVVVLLLFVILSARIGLQNQFGPGGPSAPPQTQTK